MDKLGSYTHSVLRYIKTIKLKTWFIITLIWVVVIVVLLVALPLVNLLSTRFSGSEVIKTDHLFVGRNFKHSPFELLDAHTICMYTIKKKHGSRLLRAYMDDLSTRYDPVKGMYFVVIIADLGKQTDYQSTYAYCTINPHSYQLTAYDEASEEQKSNLKRSFNFFSDEKTGLSN